MNTAQEYLAARVLTAPPQTLHLLVVEGALRHARRAEAALTASDTDAASAALIEARAYLGELIGGLNEQAAPELVGRVKGLFVFAYRRLAEAELHRNPANVADAIRVLQQHRDTWKSLLEQLTQETAPVAANVVDSGGVPETLTKPVPSPHLPRRVPAGYDDGYQPRSWSG